MGGLGSAVVFLAGISVVFAYKINYFTNMPNKNSWIVPNEHFDLTVAETSKPLFNNIFWVPPIKLGPTIDLNQNLGNTNIRSKDPVYYSKNLNKGQDVPYNNAQYDNFAAEYHEAPRTYDDDVDNAILEKEAEIRSEAAYNTLNDPSRNRKENNKVWTSSGYQKLAQAKNAVVEGDTSVEDHHGEGSDYGHHYVPYHKEEEEPHYDAYEPKKKKEIHYHQHKHLHEHDHLQEHKHQHLDEHKEKHNHEHKQYDDHKHYHQAKHEHKEEAKHYHKKHADHKHEHYQKHQHDHQNEHLHKHKQEAWHDHKDKHEHHHKEDAKHYHEKKANHDHHHDHKHEEEDKHHHNHWSEHKHGHNHHHDDKHWHDHKSDHHHQHKGHHKVKVLYKKHHW